MPLDRRQAAAVRRASTKCSDAVLALKMAAAELEAGNVDSGDVASASTSAAKVKAKLDASLVAATKAAAGS